MKSETGLAPKVHVYISSHIRNEQGFLLWPMHLDVRTCIYTSRFRDESPLVCGPRISRWPVWDTFDVCTDLKVITHRSLLTDQPLLVVHFWHSPIQKPASDYIISSFCQLHQIKQLDIIIQQWFRALQGSCRAKNQVSGKKVFL